MKVFFSWMLCLLMFACCADKSLTYAPTVAESPKSEKDMARRSTYNSVGRLYIQFKKDGKDNGYMNGTVFAVNKDHLMTAAHVCKEMMDEVVLHGKTYTVLVVYVGSNEKLFGFYDSKIKAIDLKNDLCLLEAKDHNILPVKIAFGKVSRIRDKVFTVGAPRGIFPIETEGVVALPIVRESDDVNKDSEKMLLSLSIYSGNSGGPLFNDDGELIGVVTAGDEKYENVAYAVRLEYVLSFLRESLK